MRPTEALLEPLHHVEAFGQARAAQRVEPLGKVLGLVDLEHGRSVQASGRGRVGFAVELMDMNHDNGWSLRTYTRAEPVRGLTSI